MLVDLPIESLKHAVTGHHLNSLFNLQGVEKKEVGFYAGTFNFQIYLSCLKNYNHTDAFHINLEGVEEQREECPHCKGVRVIENPEWATGPGSDGFLHKYVDTEEENWGCDECIEWLEKEYQLNSYGVCDTPEQFIERFKTFLDEKEDLYVVSLCVLKKEDEPEQGGWRWHKWGPYIGEKESQCEYLAHEGPDITQVTLFHIYRLEPKEELE